MVRPPVPLATPTYKCFGLRPIRLVFAKVFCILHFVFPFVLPSTSLLLVASTSESLLVN